MKDWLKNRSKEPTTYIGLSLLIQALGMLGKVNEAPVLSESVAAAAEPLSRGDYATGGALIVGGILAILMREKGSR